MGNDYARGSCRCGTQEVEFPRSNALSGKTQVYSCRIHVGMTGQLEQFQVAGSLCVLNTTARKLVEADIGTWRA